MKLVKRVHFTGTIQCVTGIAIKGASNELGIGGADSEVVKNPLTGEPYLPGSSLKGKLRAQLEKKYGTQRFDKKKDKITDQIRGMPCGCGQRNCRTCVVFGAHMNPGADSAPTRILVRDGTFTDAFRAQIGALPPERGSYLELKAENLINRDKGTAESPRFIERVPAGAEFTLNITLQILEGDDEAALTAYVEEGLALVEQSYLGGSGSRGYGQVKFHYEIASEEV